MNGDQEPRRGEPRTDWHLAWGGQGLGAQGWSGAWPRAERPPRRAPSLPAPDPSAVTSPVDSFPPTGRIHPALFTREPLQQRGNEPQKSATLKLPCKSRCLYSTYSHERVSGRPPACTGLQEELGQQERGPPQDSRRGGRVSTGVAAGQVSREA